MSGVADPGQYLSRELRRLDLLLHREILRLRATYKLSMDEFRGLYISDERVNEIIDQALNYDGESSVVDELTARADELRTAATDEDGDPSPWQKLAELFSLSPVEQDILLLAAAPEADLKYETLFAYLNNDISRKWPTCDLALRLCAGDAAGRVEVRRRLVPEGTLFAGGLLLPLSPSQERPSWLATGFSLSVPVSHYLSGTAALDSRLTAFVKQVSPRFSLGELPIDPEQRAALGRLPGLLRDSWPGDRVLVFRGRRGSARTSAAEAVCRELGISLLKVDLGTLRGSAENAGRLVQALLLQQRLSDAGLYLQRVEALFDGESHRLVPEAHEILDALGRVRGPLFVACEPQTNWRELFPGRRARRFDFADPAYETRLELWRVALARADTAIAVSELEALADRFSLTPGQINAAVDAALDSSALSGQTAPSLDSASLFEAARAESDQSLGGLAIKVKAAFGWNDLVLPRSTFKRVQEVAAAIKFRQVVYSEWGFEHQLAYGRGLKVLFSGASGTGKTMTAGVIAADLGLDLYKIDLSGIVSKYIGETEKNLDMIFRAAESSNAMLFFDEADALFGKRSEVKDAHDRYANIEVAYLLQKIEEYDGVVILASNLSKNIDDAFSRRMHYAVEFPLPDAQQREQLWRGMFPPKAPLGRDVDFVFLASQFSLSGGEIRNVALDSAFLAAQGSQTITMKQLMKALARQMLKQGKLPAPTDFKQYHSLILQDD